MKVILKEDVDRLGQMGDLVEVKPGYARNFLLPKHLASVATTRSLKLFEHEKRVIAARIRKEKFAAEEMARKISSLLLTLPVKVGEEGKLFGSVSSKDIAAAMLEAGIEVDKRKILLEKPIKEAGSFQVPVKVHSSVSAEVKVEVVPASDEA